MDRRLDRLYRRYCARGELAALARLFDLAAPELLAVAKHLCGDEAEAEDALQATFLTLIEKRASFDRERRFAPWALGILAKHAHAARRRAERELDPRRFDARVASEPAHELERAELRAEVGERIDALPATYAAALRAHLFDGATPAEIGARLAISSNAASVRVHRGLRLLRKLLPPGFALALVAARPARGLAALRIEVLQSASLAGAAIVPSTAAGILAGALSGGILVKKLVLSCAAVAAAVVAWTVVHNPKTLDPAKAAQEVTAPQAELQRVEEPGSSLPPASDTSSERVGVVAQHPIDASPAATHGSALVRIRREANGAPAAGVCVFLLCDSDTREATTDEHGVARFDVLLPGRWRPRVDRSRAERPFDVVAGEEAEVEIVLDAALDLSGIVVNFRGEPVAGADVLLVSPSVVSSGRPATTSGADGRFTLLDVNPRCRLHARARGYAPSAVRFLTDPMGGSAGPLDVRLVLPARGASLAGRVLDSDGMPVAGAALELGGFQDGFSAATESFGEPMERAPDGSMSGPPRSVSARTDEHGEFACEGVELGTIRVRVLASRSSLANWSGTTEVRADEANWLEVRLGRGATIAGRVTDEGGAPLPRIEVEVWGADQSLRREGRTDDDGRYTIEHVPAGRVELRANKRRSKGLSMAFAEIELFDERAFEWDALLSTAPVIAGRAIDERGEPLAGWSARACVPAEPMSSRPSTTGTDGRFRIEGCAAASYRVELRPPDADSFAPPRAWRENVEPGVSELELVADTTPGSRVLARVVDARGEPLGDVRLWATLQPIGRYATADADRASGAVELLDLPAGHYMLTLVSPRYPNEQLGERELAADIVLDLGTLTLADPGRIVLRVLHANGSAPEGLEVNLRKADGGQSSVPIAVESPGLARSGAAPAGGYALTLRAPACASKRIELELAQGEQLERAVVLERGVECVLRFEPPRGVEARWASVEILDPSGVLLLRAHAFDAEHQGRLSIAERLGPGHYVLRATSTNPPLAGEVEIEVLDASGEQSFLVPLAQ